MFEDGTFSVQQPEHATVSSVIPQEQNELKHGSNDKNWCLARVREQVILRDKGLNTYK